MEVCRGEMPVRVLRGSPRPGGVIPHLPGRESHGSETFTLSRWTFTAVQVSPVSPEREGAVIMWPDR